MVGVDGNLAVSPIFGLDRDSQRSNAPSGGATILDYRPREPVPIWYGLQVAPPTNGEQEAYHTTASIDRESAAWNFLAGRGYHFAWESGKSYRNRADTGNICDANGTPIDYQSALKQVEKGMEDQRKSAPATPVASAPLRKDLELIMRNAIGDPAWALPPNMRMTNLDLYRTDRVR